MARRATEHPIGLAVYEWPCKRASTFWLERKAEKMDCEARVADKGSRPPVRILA